jgi:rabconnectin-3b
MTCIGLSPKLFYVTPAPESRLVTHDLQIVPPAYAVAAPESLQPSAEALSSSSVTPAAALPSLPNRLLPIPNPFKPILPSRSSDKSSVKTPVVVPGRVVLGSALNFGQIPTLRGDSGPKGLQVWTLNGECLRGALWNHRDFAVRKITSFCDT